MNPITRAGAFGASLPLLLISSLALAENTATELDEVVVTANRVARTVDETLAPVTVITRKDIERYQAVELSEVLRRVPGLSISNSGGIGKATSIFIRGTGSGHVLVLINGVRQGSATLGSTSFQDIPVDQIDRIEVVRGPRSSLYGSEAIGGVIQIFTRKGGKPSVELSIGSNKTIKGNVNFAGKNANTWYNVNLSSLKTDNFNVRNTVFDFSSFPATEVVNTELDDDGYKRNSISLNIGHKFAPRLQGDISLLHTTGDSDYDGSRVNQSDFFQQVISGSLTADLNDYVNVKLQIGQARDDSDNFLNGTFRTRFNTKRDSASLLADIEINDSNSILLGADWNDAKVDSTTAYDVSSRSSKGLFAGYSAQLNHTGFDASLRYDDNEQFGSYKTGGIAVSQNIHDKVLLKASYGTAFKAPTFNQLYFPGFGDATLRPQTSKNYELGMSGRLQQGHWELNAFHNKIIDNLVVGATATNIDKTRIRGIEAIHSTNLSGFDISTNITYQLPRNESNNALLRNRPRKLFNLDIDRKFGKWGVGSSIHAESKRFTNTANTDKLAGYTLLDLRASYALNKDWSLGLKVSNVLDKDYETNNTYNQDGANGLLSIKYSPK